MALFISNYILLQKQPAYVPKIVWLVKDEFQIIKKKIMESYVELESISCVIKN